MIDYDVIGADLSLNDYEPTCSPKPQINFYTLTFPLIEIQPIELNDKYQQILLHSLKIKHEKFRNAHWMIYKIIRKRKNMLYTVSNEIKGKEEINQLEEKLEL